MAEVGRPLKFKTVEDLESAENGEIEIDGRILSNKQFDKEKDIERFIISNMEEFVSYILEDSLISYEVDKPIDIQRFGPRGRRVDLLIKAQKKTYIIEIKNPSSGTENRAAIGQILDYGREFLYPKKELIIITTKFDINTAMTIDFYNLPIRYIYLDKVRFLEYLNKNND